MNKHGWKYKKLGEVCEKGSSDIVISKVSDNNGEYPLFGAAGYIKGLDFFHNEAQYIGIVKDGAGVGRVGIYPAKSSLVGTMQYIFPNDLCDIRYLKYVLINLSLEKFKTGATIPHIYFKHYSKCLIPVPPMAEQEAIVAELDEINDAIAELQQQIAELDTLAQSSFYDMFGDPITNPKGWEVKKLNESVQEMFLGPFGSALKVSSYVPESESFAMVYEQKHAIQGTLNLENHFINKDKFDSLSRFEVKPKDFIMSCRGTIGRIYQLPDNAPKGIIHPSLMKIRIKNNVYTYSFFVILLQKVIAEQTTKGNCVQMAITAKELGNMDFILPPLALQQEFASRVEAIEDAKAELNAQISEMQTLLASRMDYYFD